MSLSTNLLLQLWLFPMALQLGQWALRTTVPRRPCPLASAGSAKRGLRGRNAGEEGESRRASLCYFLLRPASLHPLQSPAPALPSL